MSNKPENEFNRREISLSAPDESVNMEEIHKKKKKKHSFFRLRNIILTLLLVVLLGGGYFLYQTGAAFDEMTGQSNSLIKSIAKMIPGGDNFFQILPTENDEMSAADKFKSGELDRLNILLLGYRGVGDPNGGLLTDTMMVASIKKSTGDVALISIPRDLYVTMPHSDEKGKINEAYENGMKVNGWQGALAYSKQEIETVTGLDIHYATSVDFAAFKEIIDTMGGVTVYLDEPFSEAVPFEEGYISLPAGKNVLNGEKALLYSRARYSSSDFARAKRQQNVLMAVKEKAFSLGLITNPSKIMSIMSSLGNHVRTDAELWEIKDMAMVAGGMDIKNIKQLVFDTSAAGLLFDSHTSGGAYILLPEGGSYDKMHAACENIFSGEEQK